MKRINIILLLTFVVIANVSLAQDSKNQYFPLSVWVSDNIDGMPDASKQVLSNKLLQIVTNNGISSSMGERFILTANIITSNKEITASAPPMYVLNLDITFYIGDGLEGKNFASKTVSAKGVGETDIKAFNSAIKSVKVNDQSYQDFINKGKNQIIKYYNTKCDQIIASAKSLAKMHSFDEALWSLTSVPDVCEECWGKAMTAAEGIFMEKINFECKTKVAAAQNSWNADQSWDGAQNAGAILSTIDPLSTCFSEAQALSKQIAKRIQEVDKREWNIVYEKEVGLQRDLIKAYRDIGVAYGNGQAKNVTYKTLW